MGTAYEIWKNVMYCVGVFVTCNVVGGTLLLMAVRKSRGGEPEEAAPVVEAEIVANGGGQAFEEMRRQVDALENDEESATA